MKYLDLGLSDMHKAFLQMRLVCLLMIILPGTLWAQNTKISGQVIDDTGEPVIGATVRLKGGYDRYRYRPDWWFCFAG